jgi:hypothetical protein
MQCESPLIIHPEASELRIKSGKKFSFCVFGPLPRFRRAEPSTYILAAISLLNIICTFKDGYE